MTGEERQADRLRPTTALLTAGAVLLLSMLLYAVNYAGLHTPEAVPWLPALTATVLGAWTCRRTSRTPGLNPVTARVWRSLAVVCVLIMLGIAGDIRYFTVNPAAVDQQHDIPTSALYAAAILVLLWALLRLPMGERERQERVLLRFALDAATVAVTLAIFSWYVIHRVVDAWRAGPTAVVPMLTLSALGLIGSLAFVKVAMSDLGGLDRIALRWLAVAAAVGAAGGGLLPLLIPLHPGLSGSMMFIPATLLCVEFAADRQRRAAGVRHLVRRRRSFSVVPYLAVAATDGLLLVVGSSAGRVVLTVSLAAVVLTALVVVRQVNALRDNGRLLRRVHANQRELAHRASHDDLTQLANRTLFEQETRGALADPGTTLSLAMIDLDDFKAINDRLGHAVGDALLVVVAERLREAVRADDMVARFGGDEFGLLLRGLPAGEATEVLDRIAEALTRPVHALGFDLLVKASIGLAEAWPAAGSSELLRRADLAMYAAKERGKGRYAIYDARLERDQAADAQLGAELRQAMNDGDLFLVYQPIVALPHGEWTSLETLIRWKHPERGFVSPDVFIPIAERTGLIVPLGDWILRTALHQAAQWRARFGTAAPAEIGVNVSARQLREPGFAADVRSALADTGFDPERLVVEVTETAVFDGGMALDTLRDLVTLGVKVALDDFGTGHSSLGLLRTVPADTLKVDKSFVDGIGGRSEEAVIATAMIQITNGLHLQAIAEGVETAEQAETLHRLGYRFAQGYHFDRPLTADQVTERLSAPRTLPV
ncbi:bifunctional diguanylate cyclase/phosphodiesterase [Actinoplanes sp. N902-109]|uniref:putative bifunctional diguanylate cyclase/phosphodiesterase n=1 Tax=Actinoplanes sp. (strain N902-109) TaxID=649831 RepID=UPI0003293DFB|nr:bifunctional diguanylate cyclase/phosphodiesterase [Actinoplanes sp. N902-109]AGL19687.1 diguanylate cyclase/phosphodiesterase [Actinoplanes sp. N902-109]